MSQVKETGEKRRVGDGTPGPGRPKGSPNKTTASVKEAICEAFERRGGVDALVTWAQNNETEFYKLWGKLVPKDVEIAGKDGGPIEATVTIRWGAVEILV